MVDAPVERRGNQRYSVQATARLQHDASERSFPCQCTDVSLGGARLLVPATMPVRAGHDVHLTGAGGFTDNVHDLGPGELAAVVVRVDREHILADGHVEVAVRFSGR